MFTKLLAGGVLTLVMGVAIVHLYNPSGFCFNCSHSEKSPSACCSTPTAEPTSSSCCTESCCTESCCTVAPTVAPGTIFYCPATDEFYDECCCTIVNGQYVCNITGNVSAECCCYPISD